MESAEPVDVRRMIFYRPALRMSAGCGRRNCKRASQATIDFVEAMVGVKIRGRGGSRASEAGSGYPSITQGKHDAQYRLCSGYG